MAPAIVQSELYQEEKTDATDYDTLASGLSPRLPTLCDIEHKSYTMTSMI